MKNLDQRGEGEVGWVVAGVVLLLLVVAGSMVGCPQYNVYEQRQEGEAELAKASYSKQVAVQEATAKNEAASMLASAEITRAYGVAKANEIIGKSLEGNEAYLRYLWISEMKETQNQIIYLPTEAGLPVLEADRLANKPQVKPVN